MCVPGMFFFNFVLFPLSGVSIVLTHAYETGQATARSDDEEGQAGQGGALHSGDRGVWSMGQKRARAIRRRTGDLLTHKFMYNDIVVRNFHLPIGRR